MKSLKEVINNSDGTVTLKSDSGIDQTGTPELLSNADCFVHAEGLGFLAGFFTISMKLSSYFFV